LLIYKGVITINVIERNLYGIHKTVENLSFNMKEVSLDEQDECIEEIIKRFKEQKYYSLKELNILTDKQLKILAERLKLQVEAKDIEEELANQILETLRWKKDWAIERVSETPIRQNPGTECSPIIPVIDEKVLNISKQMKLFRNGGKQERNFVPLERIKNDYEFEEPEDCYWMVDVRMNELRYDCHFLTVAETIAYALHNPRILSKYTLDSVNSRYKYVKNDTQLYLRIIEGYPILHWARNDYFAPIKKIGKPSCALRLIH